MKLKSRRPSKDLDAFVPLPLPTLTNEEVTSAATKLKTKKKKRLKKKLDYNLIFSRRTALVAVFQGHARSSDAIGRPRSDWLMLSPHLDNGSFN